MWVASQVLNTHTVLRPAQSLSFSSRHGGTIKQTCMSIACMFCLVKIILKYISGLLKLIKGMWPALCPSIKTLKHVHSMVCPRNEDMHPCLGGGCAKILKLTDYWHRLNYNRGDQVKCKRKPALQCSFMPIDSLMAHQSPLFGFSCFWKLWSDKRKNGSCSRWCKSRRCVGQR